MMQKTTGKPVGTPSKTNKPWYVPRREGSYIGAWGEGNLKNGRRAE
jgi:hypothetical protein